MKLFGCIEDPDPYDSNDDVPTSDPDDGTSSDDYGSDSDADSGAAAGGE